MATNMTYTVYKGARQTGLGEVIARGGLAISGTHAASPVITNPTGFDMTVRLTTDTLCYQLIDVDAVAQDDPSVAERMFANTIEYYQIKSGQRVSVIAGS